MGNGIFDENGNKVYTTVYRSKIDGNFINLDMTPISISYNELNSLGYDPSPVVDPNYRDENEGRYGRLLWCIDDNDM